MGAARAGVPKIRLKHTHTHTHIYTKNNIKSNPESDERCNGRGNTHIYTHKHTKNNIKSNPESAMAEEYQKLG
jgi:hypothetical protein